MKKLTFGLLILVSFTACLETFIEKDVAKFNEKISARTDISSAKELIELYYRLSPDEGAPQLEISSKQLKGNKFQTTLIHNGLKDDSVSAIKVIMIAERIGKKWQVLQIKENFKCWEGRGHQYWSEKYCS